MDITTNRLDKNIDKLHNITMWIKKNESIASQTKDVNFKTLFVGKLLDYETIRKDTIDLLRSYFSEKRTIVNFNYWQLYKRLTDG